MKKTYIYIIILLTCFSLTSKAQYWESLHGDDSVNLYQDILLSPDGSIFSTGYTIDSISTQRNLWLTKSDANGNLVWEKTQSFDTLSTGALKILINPNNNLFVLGNYSGTPDREAVAWEVNPSGQTIASYENFPTSHLITDGLFTSDGKLIVCGDYALGTSPVPDAFIAEMNADYSGFEWIQYFGGNSIEAGASLLQLSNGLFALTGYTASFGNGVNAFLVFTDQNGNLVDEVVISSAVSTSPREMKEYNGSIWITGLANEFQGNDQDIFLMETSLTGDSLNFWINSELGLQDGRGLSIADDGSIFIVGSEKKNGNPFAFKLQRWDTNGNILWDRSIQSLDDHVGNAVEVISDSLLYAAGYISPIINGDEDGYLLHPSTDGVWNTAIVEGNVFWDENQNCTNEQEPNLGEWLVQAQGDFTRWTLTDSFGNYSFSLDTGAYQISVFPPNDYWAPCNFNTIVNINTPTDSIFTSHGIQAAIDCPLLTVDLGTPLLRRCFQNTYQVKICNEGTFVADNAFVEIEFDADLVVDGSSLPWTSNQGQLYTFDLGNLAALDCIQFSIDVTVSCDAVLGQTHCIEAHAYPDSICDPLTSNWDLSSLEVDANCLGDSIQFTISNIGSGNTSVPQPYIIIEDHIMFSQGEVDLEVGEDTVITIPSTGGMIRMELEQAVGHPGNSNPSVTIEGCGAFPFSLGYVIQYSYNDANPFVDIDCRENVGSYDPNDKQAFPLGYRDDHFIEVTDKIEYLIRFQNTGTDTAFTVVIKDTLSSNLDLTSLEFGATSHPARWSFGAGNQLEIRFENILLPDSTTNEAASHGYAKFTIYPKASLQPGAQIFNQAGIYFDFNSPIITNRTYHTIGIDYLIIDILDGQNNPKEPISDLTYYPNPFLEHIYFELKNKPAGNLTFQLMDLQGRIIHQQEIQDSRFSYRHIDRSPGIYFFQLLHEGATVSTGKIICQ